MPDGHILCESHLPATAGPSPSKHSVAKGDLLLVIESMKMGIEIQAATAGIVRELLCKPGQAITTGQPLALLEIAG